MSRRAFICLVAGLAALGGGTAQAQQNPSFNLLNRSEREIMVINVSPNTDRIWGEDRLGVATLPAGHYLPIRLRSGQCRNDIRVIYADGTHEERRNLNTCSVTDVTFDGSQAEPGSRRGSNTEPSPRRARGQQSQQGQPALRIVNHSGRAIQAVHATPDTVSSWGSSLIRGRIRDGANQQISLPRGSCIYDIRVVFTDRSDDQRRSVNLCTEQEQIFE